MTFPFVIACCYFEIVLNAQNVHLDISPYPLFLSDLPTLNQQTVQGRLFRQSLPLSWLSGTLPPQN